MNPIAIKNDIARLMKHTPLCASQRKEKPGDCNCYHTGAVEELHSLFLKILKGNK